MIEKLKKQNTWGECLEKLNELVDAVNDLLDRVNTCEHCLLETDKLTDQLIKSNNIHEKQIDELQMKIRPIIEERESGIKVYEEAQHMYDNAILDALKGKEVDVVAEPADPYAEQRKWIGRLCRFWDDNSKIIKHFGILTRIDETAIVRYEAENGFWYCACEPVKPDDDVIYKGGDNE